MKHLQLIVEIKEEKYNYTRESYDNLLLEIKKVNPIVTQLLIDTSTKRIYCYSNKELNNLIA